MSLEHWFRLSQYLTLGLSCTALVFAEAPFLPELQLYLAPVLAMLLLAWWVEGRWGLPNWGANILGLLIAVGGITWLVMQLRDGDSVLAHLPWHLALLPYIGPLSIAALLVKVFRLRDAGHFWHLQGLGLLQIGLGCLLDGGPAFGAMLIAYLASDLVCLTLHYRLSSQLVNGRSPGRDRKATVESRSLANGRDPAEDSTHITHRWLFGFTLRWTLLILTTALAIFLLTPRREGWSWEPLSKLGAGSKSSNQGTIEEMNLNSTGWVELDDAVAVRVSAIDSSGEPKLDLPADQHWRGSVLDWYEHGRWTTMHLMPVRRGRTNQLNLPNFGPHQYYLTFTVQPRQAGGLVLAEPISLSMSPPRLPVIVLGNEERRRLFAEFSGTVLSQVPADQRREYHYCQVMSADIDPERFPAENLWPPKDFEELLKSLPPVLRLPLHDVTVEILRRLSQRPQYHLPESVRANLARSEEGFQVAPPHWEAVARALTEYLAHSGEYTYTLEIVRQDRLLDPVLDFLVNTKQGHCERYAAALALMLRSIGVPARVVKGYRGCDNQGNGQYIVRHSHAHAWVEMLVPRKRVANVPFTPLRGRPSYDWLILDATPPEATAAEGRLSLAHLWTEIGRFCLQWWRALILEYDGDEQADLWYTLISMRSLSLLLYAILAAAVCGAGFAIWLLVHRLRMPRPPARIQGGFALYSRLVQLLTRHVSLRPTFGQTPREYGTSAEAILLTRPALVALADLPRRVVELFYRVRFGGQPLNETERQRIETELDHFAQTLRHPTP